MDNIENENIQKEEVSDEKRENQIILKQADDIAALKKYIFDQNKMMYEQRDAIKVIKNCVLFFTILTVIGLVVGLIAFGFPLLASLA